MSDINDLDNSNSNEKEEEQNLNQINDEFTQKIFELELIIKEKEEIINTLHTKIKEFSSNIDQLKVENEKLKNQLMYIEEEIEKNKYLFKYISLEAQQTQRFVVNGEINKTFDSNYLMNFNLENAHLINNSNHFINNLYNNENSLNLYNDIRNEFIDESFKSKIIPFQMKPFKNFDHKKLEIKENIKINDIQKDNKLFYEVNFLNNINGRNISCKNNNNENIYFLENDFKNNYDKENKRINNNSKINNNSSYSYNKNKDGKKVHSSMFFQKCKQIMSKNEYKKMLDIVKLSNLKKISKEETYLKITSLLDDNYPELSNEFKLLFI